MPFFFSNPSLDAIIGSFTKTMAQLETFEENQRVESSSLYAQAKELETQAYNKNRDADKASRIRGNMAKLFEDNDDD